jgi:hypothetical protein
MLVRIENSEVVRCPPAGREIRAGVFTKGSVQRIALRCILCAYYVYKFGRRVERAGM